MGIAQSIIEWAAGQVVVVVETAGSGGVFLLMALESANIPIPSEVIMPFAGFAASVGRLSFWAVVVAGALGNLAGSLVSYWIGLKGGRPFFKKYGKYLLIHEADLARGDRAFARWGPKIAFWSRLLPIVRTFISLPAGINRSPLKGFAFYTFLGSLIWSWLLASLGFWLGENWQVLRPAFESLSTLIAGFIVLMVVVYIWHHLKNHKNTRTLEH